MVLSERNLDGFVSSLAGILLGQMMGAFGKREIRVRRSCIWLTPSLPRSDPG